MGLGLTHPKAPGLGAYLQLIATHHEAVDGAVVREQLRQRQHARGVEGLLVAVHHEGAAHAGHAVARHVQRAHEPRGRQAHLEVLRLFTG
jgi:hypothetical protein